MKIAYTICALLIVAILVAAGIGAVEWANESKFDTADYYTKTIKIEKGDTLWELGSIYKAEGDDVRDWIKAVKNRNYMSDSGLTAGDYITIYIAK